MKFVHCTYCGQAIADVIVWGDYTWHRICLKICQHNLVEIYWELVRGLFGFERRNHVGLD